MTGKNHLIAFGWLMLLPAVAWANAGTPLMWAKPLHLVIGNLLIAVFEAACLCLLLRPRRLAFGRLLLVLVPLNYASAGLGWWLFDAVLVPRLDLHIGNIHAVLGWSMLAAFGLTLLVEGPGIVWVFRQRGAVWRRSLLAPLLGHLLSYPAMLLWYAAASSGSLLDRCNLVPPAAIAWPTDYALWYIDRDGNQLRRFDSDGDHRLQQIRSMARNDRLVARPDGGGRFDLCLARIDHDGRYASYATHLVELIPGFTSQANTESSVAADEKRPVGSWHNFGRVQPLAESRWTVDVGHWPIEGLRLDHPDHGSRRLAMEMPGAFWPIRNAQLLPGDLLIFQLGWDQICILDLPTMRLALVIRGRGPVIGRRPPAAL